MKHTYHQEEAELGPMVFERLSDMRDQEQFLGDFKDIRGMTVVNPKGDEVGKVDELYVDPKQEKPVMAGIAFGGVWGFGAKHVLVPLDQLEVVGEERIRVITTPEIVKGAPEFTGLDDADFRKYHEYWCKAMKEAKRGKAA